MNIPKGQETYFQDLRESLHNLTLFVTIQLDRIDERHFRLSAITKRFKDFGKLPYFPVELSVTLNYVNKSSHT
jgi:hypothetical protein